MSQRSADEFTPLLIAGKIGGRNLLDQGGDAAYAVVWKARNSPLTFVCARVDDTCHYCNAYMFATCCDMLTPAYLCIFNSRTQKSVVRNVAVDHAQGQEAVETSSIDASPSGGESPS